MRAINLFFILLLPLITMAAEPDVTVAARHQAIEAPHQKVEKATEQLLALINEAKEYFEKDPERYFREVDVIMDKLIDFSSFTRSVMGPYGTSDYYKSLKTSEERDSYKANYKRFVTTFRGGLINTYGKGMLAFNGQKIEITPATEEDLALIAKNESVEVEQLIKDDNEIYKVVYKMRPDKNGEWLLRNVSIGSVNVGSLYRNQFIAAMDKYENDFGKVIDNWVIEAQIASEEVKTAKK